MKRGSLYWVNLEPSEPPEFGKIRPSIIVSNFEQNLRLPTVVVVPVSSRAPEIWPLRLKFKMPGGKESFAVLPGLRQINKTRLQKMTGLVAADFLQELDAALVAYLSD